MFAAIVFSTLGFRDLTNNIRSLKRSQEEIKYLNAFNENMLKTVPIGIIVVGKNGDISYDNPMFNKLNVLLKADQKEIEPFNFKRTDPKSILLKNYQLAITEGKSFEMMKYPIKLGRRKRIHLNIKGEPLKNIKGEIDGVLIVIENVTDRIKLEEQLYHSEKLASIGQLAAGVAHELNTPLMNISLVTENIQTLTQDKDVLEDVETISGQVFNAAKIVDDLLLFSRKRTAEFVDVEINEIIENTLLQLHEKKPGNIQVVKSFDSELPIIQGDSNLLERVLINIIENAFDAMPDGGTLKLATGTSGNNVQIKITDTGTGIPDEDLKKIFNPFYTTKGPGSGTGLGLAICHGIIHEHSGKLEVQSTVGAGTTFIIELPR
jgi:two-component system NtrC family sensor kinase